MKRFFFFSAVGCIAISSLLHAQTVTDPNEGLRLEPDSSNPNGYFLRWWGHPGRVYFIENSATLSVGSWSTAPLLFQGTHQLITQQVGAEGERFFTRLRCFDGNLEPYNEDRDHDGISTGEEFFYGTTKTNPIAYPDRDQDDGDTDGLPDAWEWTYLKTLGFSATDEYDPASAPGSTCLALYQSLRPDTDDDGLPDDWERQRVGDLSEDASTLRDGRTNLVRFREDRLRLARHR